MQRIRLDLPAEPGQVRPLEGVVDRPSQGTRAVERTLRTAQDLDVLEIERGNVGRGHVLVRISERDVLDEDAGGLLTDAEVVRRRVRADSADREQVAVGGSLVELDPGRQLEDLLRILGPERLQGFSGQDVDMSGKVPQVLPTFRNDDDLLGGGRCSPCTLPVIRRLDAILGSHRRSADTDHDDREGYGSRQERSSMFADDPHLLFPGYRSVDGLIVSERSDGERCPDHGGGQGMEAS